MSRLLCALIVFMLVFISCERESDIWTNIPEDKVAVTDPQITIRASNGQDLSAIYSRQEIQVKVDNDLVQVKSIEILIDNESVAKDLSGSKELNYTLDSHIGSAARCSIKRYFSSGRYHYGKLYNER